MYMYKENVQHKFVFMPGRQHGILFRARHIYPRAFFTLGYSCSELLSPPDGPGTRGKVGLEEHAKGRKLQLDRLKKKKSAEGRKLGIEPAAKGENRDCGQFPKCIHVQMKKPPAA